VAGATTDWSIADDGAFMAPLRLSYPYSRTVGPTMTRFLSGLAQRRIEGTRGGDGRVHVPPLEFDPDTGDPLTEWVAVGDAGVVETWCWQAEPLADQPLERPFAWALVRLDGADTAMLHAVAVTSAALMASGMRVRARWSVEPLAAITGLACFEPDEPTANGGV
jgi:hypothetical protein